MKKILLSLALLMAITLNVFSQANIPTSGPADFTSHRGNLSWQSVDTAFISIDTYKHIITDQSQTIRELYQENDLYRMQKMLLEIKQLFCLQYTDLENYCECIINSTKQ